MIKMLLNQMAMDNPPFIDDLPFENDSYISVVSFAFERVPVVNTHHPRSAKRPNLPSHSAGHVFPHQSRRRTWCHVRESPGCDIVAAKGAEKISWHLWFINILISTCLNIILYINMPALNMWYCQIYKSNKISLCSQYAFVFVFLLLR